MKIKLQDIVNDEPNLRQLTEVKLPIKVSYKLSKIHSKILFEIKTFQELRNKLVLEYGKEDKKTKQTSVTPENLPKFIEELNKLTDLEVDIDFELIKIADLGEIQIEPKLLIPWVFE